jgi:hypothetical protein
VSVLPNHEREVPPYRQDWTERVTDRTNEMIPAISRVLMQARQQKTALLKVDECMSIWIRYSQSSWSAKLIRKRLPTLTFSFSEFEKIAFALSFSIALEEEKIPFE